MELGRIAHPVVDLPPFETFGLRHGQAARLEGADSGRDHHRARIEHRAGTGEHVEAAVFLFAQLHGFLAQVQLGAEWLDLLQQALDQFLRTTDRQRRNVVDGLVGIKLGALAARGRKRVEQVRLDAQQAELEHLEQAGRTGADDDRFGRDGLAQFRCRLQGYGPRNSSRP